MTEALTINTLETDGAWCPMAHGNRNDNSFQDLPPLRRVRTFQKITDLSVSPCAAFNLGAFTGEAMAVCAYASPSHPALVAYHYDDGSIRWTSPPEDLPDADRRRVAGILLAKMGVNGKPVQRYVFAANPAEFVAYDADGIRIWKRATTEITKAASNGIGGPTALRFNDAKELVTATNEGWVVKLNPMNGNTIDAYKMDTNIVVDGRIYRGTFVTFKSPVVIRNTLYLMVEFKAHPSTPLYSTPSPVHVIRIDLNQPGVRGQENSIKPLSQPEKPSDPTPDRVLIGIRRARGSPSAWVTQEGRVLIFANAETLVNHQIKPAITAVEDAQGRLSKLWQSVLKTMPGDAIHAAPALHQDSRTLLVGTKNSVFVFRDIDAWAGNVSSPVPLYGAQLITCGMERVGVGSPFALAFDPDASEIVAYTNFRVFPGYGYRMYGFLGAFALPIRGHGAPRPLWCQPLALTANGEPAPGPGTFGQPALFRYRARGGEATGLIVNTVCTGTYIFK